MLQLANPEYLKIEGAYGGNQEWFHDGYFSHGDLIYFGGCGLIAMTDLVLYLSQTDRRLQAVLPNKASEPEISKVYYASLVEQFFYLDLQPWRNPFFNAKGYQEVSQFVLGIQGWQFKKGLKHFYRRQGLARPDISFKSLRKNQASFSQLIQTQLAKNCPVPLLIGPTKEMFPSILAFLGREQGANSAFLPKFSAFESVNESQKYPQKLESHWVTITGYSMNSTSQQEQVLIASWGQSYVLDLSSFMAERDWLSGIIVI